MSQAGGETTVAGRPPGRGSGGYRPGSGRKPRGRFVPLQGDLAYAKDLVSVLMRDESQPAAVRVRCAIAVLNGSAARCRRPAKGEADPGDAGPAADGEGPTVPEVPSVLPFP